MVARFGTNCAEWITSMLVSGVGRVGTRRTILVAANPTANTAAIAINGCFQANSFRLLPRGSVVKAIPDFVHSREVLQLLLSLVSLHRAEVRVQQILTLGPVIQAALDARKTHIARKKNPVAMPTCVTREGLVPKAIEGHSTPQSKFDPLKPIKGTCRKPARRTAQSHRASRRG